MEYILLLSSSFLSATILPFASEAVLAAYLQQGLPALPLIGVATLGNTAGACINWGLGRYLLHFHNNKYNDKWKDRKWFYFSAKDIKRAQIWFHRYGLWTLCFAWLPIIGDPLTLIAGTMRVHWLPFVILVGLGKALRYCFIAWVFL